MREGKRSTPQPWPYEELAPKVLELLPPASHNRNNVRRNDAAMLLDGLLVRVARSRGAIEIGIGESLAVLLRNDNLAKLGYASLGDYSRERVGIAPRTAQALVRLTRELSSRARLRLAVLCGKVSVRKAETILKVAIGEDEEKWVELAKEKTVRGLEALVRGVPPSPCPLPPAGGEGKEEEERWWKIYLDVGRERRPKLDEALELAGQVIGTKAPRWQCLESVCQEFLGAYPLPEGQTAGCRILADDGTDWERIKAGLEAEYKRWSFLEKIEENVEAPIFPDIAYPEAVDEHLRELVAARDRWDELLGRLAMILSMLRLWRDMQFASMAHYVEERLGMSPRTVQRRVWLERKLWELPGLREAMAKGVLTYEKACLVARYGQEHSIDRCIQMAAGMTCIAIRRMEERDEDAKMCARGRMVLWVPERVKVLVSEAIAAARAAEGRFLSPGEALEVIAEHFLSVWKGKVATIPRSRRVVLERNDGWCEVPGCSHAATHLHHVVPRSHGGGDGPENLVGLCASHHLHGVHLGYLRITGRASGGFHFEMAAPPR